MTSVGRLSSLAIRPRSRLRRRQTAPFEFVHPACLDSITYLPRGRDHSAHIPDHGYFRRDRPHLAGMAPVRSGQAPAWPLVSDRSVRRGSRVKCDFTCTLARCFPPVLVVLRTQSRLMLEGRTRTLSGPSPDLTSSASGLFGQRAVRVRDDNTGVRSSLDGGRGAPASAKRLAMGRCNRCPHGMVRVVLGQVACQPEKRKVDSSILSLTTSFGLLSSALTRATAD
jgi:hypothetical protein